MILPSNMHHAYCATRTETYQLHNKNEIVIPTSSNTQEAYDVRSLQRYNKLSPRIFGRPVGYVPFTGYEWPGLCYQLSLQSRGRSDKG